MKKIGILTYHSSDNYGSVLQAYALQKHLNKYYTCEIIDYRKKEVFDLYKIFKPFNNKYNIITNLYKALYLKRIKACKKEYELFRNNELCLSKIQFNSKEEIALYVKNFDILICGSDQVWNFDIIDFDTSFMLDFDGFTGKRFAYAVSFGPNKKSIDDVNKYKALLERFDKITVREITAKTTLDNILANESTLVTDPTLLIDKDEWCQFAKKSTLKIKGDYIFCYFPGGVSCEMENFSKSLAKKHCCKRILVMPEWRNIIRNGKKYYQCSPYDFVKLIKNAKYVCTTSFHGTAFSVILNTPFFVGYGNGISDSRIEEILNLSGNQKSLITKKCTAFNDKITLKQLIDNSKEIIHKCIEG